MNKIDFSRYFRSEWELEPTLFWTTRRVIGMLVAISSVALCGVCILAGMFNIIPLYMLPFFFVTGVVGAALVFWR